MSNNFNDIGILTNSAKPHVSKTIEQLLPILLKQRSGIRFYTPANYAFNSTAERVGEQELIAQSDLIIVVGGDGNFLKAARVALSSSAKLLGVNCGRLGFLVDINPEKLEQEIDGILAGNYIEDQRSLLSVGDPGLGGEQLALNDVAFRGDHGHMTEIEIYLDGAGTARLRCDGLVIATPTGSTAYALAAGGPLLHPSMPAFVIVPIAAHALNARPIVVSDASKIEVRVHNRTHLWLDGAPGQSLASGASAWVGKASRSVSLVHPEGYEYFEVCRQKLGWSGVAQSR